MYYCDENCIQKNLSFEFSASFIFSILTILISIYHISMHLANFNNPFFQSKIIGTQHITIQSSWSWRPSTVLHRLDHSSFQYLSLHYSIWKYTLPCFEILMRLFYCLLSSIWCFHIWLMIVRKYPFWSYSGRNLR